MLAGLIFATEDAADRRDALAATLPFGGASLIEFQARLLISAGAAQILIAVARVTPELLGAAARIGKRGVAVDVVRSTAEAAAKVHPLARVVVLADGLVTTEQVLAPFVADGGDLLLVTDVDEGLERIDATSCWAGIARMGAQRLTQAAELPRDYDFLSTLLRVAAQHGAAKMMLAPGTLREGHGVEHDSRGLARRGRGVFAALAGQKTRWVERWVVGPLARLVLPGLVARGVSPMALLATGAAVGIGSWWAIWQGWATTGFAGATLSCAIFLTGGLLAGLRGDEDESGWAEAAGLIVAAGGVFLGGIAEDQARGTATGSVLAVALIVAAGLLERVGTIAAPRRWWPAAAAYPLLLVPFAIVGQTLTGLAALALYAALSTVNGIEQLRPKA